MIIEQWKHCRSTEARGYGDWHDDADAIAGVRTTKAPRVNNWQLFVFRCAVHFSISDNPLEQPCLHSNVAYLYLPPAPDEREAASSFEVFKTTLLFFGWNKIRFFTLFREELKGWQGKDQYTQTLLCAQNVFTFSTRLKQPTLQVLIQEDDSHHNTGRWQLEISSTRWE